MAKPTMISNNRLVRASAATFIIAGLLGPLMVAAQPQAVVSATKPEGGSFCARVDQLRASALKQHDGLRKQLDSSRAKQVAELDSKKKENDTYVTGLTKTVDTQRDQQITKLAEKAKDPAKKTALSTFQRAVAAAVSARRMAITASNNAYRLSLKDAIAKRKASADVMLKTYQDAVLAASSKAKSDCATKVDPAVARETFLSAIKTAKDKLQGDKKILERLEETIAPLISVRRAAHEKALADFKVAMEKARADLKVVLGNE